jgi:hypothetical protein
VHVLYIYRKSFLEASFEPCTHPYYRVQLSHGDLLGSLHCSGHLLLVLQQTASPCHHSMIAVAFRKEKQQQPAPGQHVVAKTDKSGTTLGEISVLTAASVKMTAFLDVAQSLP